MNRWAILKSPSGALRTGCHCLFSGRPYGTRANIWLRTPNPSDKSLGYSRKPLRGFANGMSLPVLRSSLRDWHRRVAPNPSDESLGYFREPLRGFGQEINNSPEIALRQGETQRRFGPEGTINNSPEIVLGQGETQRRFGPGGTTGNSPGILSLGNGWTSGIPSRRDGRACVSKVRI